MQLISDNFEKVKNVSDEVLLSATAYQPNLWLCEKRSAGTQSFTAWLLFTVISI